MTVRIQTVALRTPKLMLPNTGHARQRLSPELNPRTLILNFFCLTRLHLVVCWGIGFHGGKRRENFLICTFCRFQAAKVTSLNVRWAEMGRTGLGACVSQLPHTARSRKPPDPVNEDLDSLTESNLPKTTLLKSSWWKQRVKTICSLQSSGPHRRLSLPQVPRFPYL